MARKKGTETKNRTMKSPGLPKRNVWKILAIVFIVLFAVILMAGFLRIDRFRPAHVQATQEQMGVARAAAVVDLAKRGEDPAALTITVADAIRHPRSPPGPIGTLANESIIEVSAYGKSVGHLYLIDAATGSILLHAKTEYFDSLDHKDDAKRRFDRRFPQR